MKRVLNKWVCVTVFVFLTITASLVSAQTTGNDYTLENVRLNSYSLEGTSGEFVLTPDKLKSGAVEVTGRLSDTANIEKVLFSEDDGRTWAELSLQGNNFSYAFTPLPDKQYQFLVKIKTTDVREIELKLFPSIDVVVYKDIDYKQMIIAAIKGIADAYEQEDTGKMMDLISADFQGNKGYLEEGVRLDFDLFTDIHLTIYINRIEERNGQFIADTKWDKTQIPNTTGLQQRTTGKTTMVFVQEEGGVKLKNLRGHLIYATLSPEMAQASGLPSNVVTNIRTAQETRNPTQAGAGTTEDSGGVSAGSGSSSTSSSITVTSPNGGEGWRGLQNREITWTSAGSITNVKIEAFINTGAGSGYVIIIASTDNDGSYFWSIPDGITDSGVLVRITDVDNSSVFDVSNSTFTIIPSAGF